MAERERVAEPHGGRGRQNPDGFVVAAASPMGFVAGLADSVARSVLPPPAVYELQKLCDSVPSYPTPRAYAATRYHMIVAV